MNIYFETQKYLNTLEDCVVKLQPDQFQQFTHLREDILRFIANNFEDERREVLMGLVNKTIDPVSGIKKVET